MENVSLNGLHKDRLGATEDWVLRETIRQSYLQVLLPAGPLIKLLATLTTAKQGAKKSKEKAFLGL